MKRGAASAFEFTWFPRTLPTSQLCVISPDRFGADRIRGTTLEAFLLAED